MERRLGGPAIDSWETLSIEEKIEALRRAVTPRSVVHVKFIRIHGHADAPRQAYPGDAGWDLSLCEEVTLQPQEQRDLRTGVVAAIPEGHWGHIIARSGVIRGFNIVIQEAVIDCGYRGELKVLARNYGDKGVTFQQGSRLAQIIVTPTPRIEWVEQAALPPHERGERGFGSSGLGWGAT